MLQSAPIDCSPRPVLRKTRSLNNARNRGKQAIVGTVAEIKSALSSLNNEQLREVEQAVRQLYRTRNNGIIFDDAYGIWTEEDQASAAAEAFRLMDQEEARNEQDKAR